MNLKKMVLRLSALGQDTRLAIFRLLVRESGKADTLSGGQPDGICAGVIAERLKVPSATLSFHLTKLEHAGLIKSRRRSLNIYYAVDQDGVRELLGYLAKDCCQCRPELCGVHLPEILLEASP